MKVSAIHTVSPGHVRSSLYDEPGDAVVNMLILRTVALTS